jgi:hypothetical protein
MWQMDGSRDKMAIINMNFREIFDQDRPTQDTFTGSLLLKAHECGNADLIRT